MLYTETTNDVNNSGFSNENTENDKFLSNTEEKNVA